MSLPYSSISDEFGTGGSVVSLRNIDDISINKGTYHLLKPEIQVIKRQSSITTSMPIVIPAGTLFIKFSGESGRWSYNGTEPMFRSYPLKTGNISNFSLSGSNTTVNSVSHGLNANDTIKIQDSRAYQYNGEFIVSGTNLTTDSFEILTTFATADGPCRWTQTKIHITVMADSTTSPGIKTTLTSNNHGLDDDVSIILSDTTNSADGTYIVSNVITNTFDIERVHTVTSIGNASTAIGSVVFEEETFQNIGASPVLLQDFQGDDSNNNISATLLENSFVFNFKLAETRDIRGIDYKRNVFVDCGGHDFYDDNEVHVIDTIIQTTFAAPLTTEQLASCWRNSFDSTTRIVVTSTDSQLATHQSLFDFPLTLNPAPPEAFFGIIFLSTDPTPGVYFSTGLKLRSSGNIVDSAGDISIPLSDTTKLRLGDGVTILDSPTYEGQTGTITVISPNTSITVDITYSVGDSDVLVDVTQLASLTEEDPGIFAVANVNLDSSAPIGSVVANGNTIATTIGSADTWFDLNLGGNAIAGSNIQKFTLITASTGELRYDGLIPFHGILTATVTLEPNGSETFFIRAVKNDLPLIDGAESRLSISGTVATIPLTTPIDLITDDEVKIQILESGGNNNPTITNLAMIIS